MCGHRNPAEQIRDSRSGNDGAIQAIVGRHRGAGVGARRCGPGRTGYRDGAFDHFAGNSGVEIWGGDYPDRTRRPGGGRKRAIDKDIALLADLEALVDSTTAGWPDAPLRWTSKSTRKLAAELQAMGHTASHRLVAELLRDLGLPCKRNERPAKASNIPIVTLSSITSTTRCCGVRSKVAR